MCKTREYFTGKKHILFWALLKFRGGGALPKLHLINYIKCVKIQRFKSKLTLGVYV